MLLHSVALGGRGERLVAAAEGERETAWDAFSWPEVEAARDVAAGHVEGLPWPGLVGRQHGRRDVIILRGRPQHSAGEPLTGDVQRGPRLAGRLAHPHAHRPVGDVAQHQGRIELAVRELEARHSRLG
ncbi:MAG TPA: hypothetical protein VMP67_06925 [Candidatus Limnocylindria bacterium]|nr:hypothetical protein [Candidatus Limnocylindria bacterium]